MLLKKKKFHSSYIIANVYHHHQTLNVNRMNMVFFHHHHHHIDPFISFGLMHTHTHTHIIDDDDNNGKWWNFFFFFFEKKIENSVIGVKLVICCNYFNCWVCQWISHKPTHTHPMMIDVMDIHSISIQFNSACQHSLCGVCQNCRINCQKKEKKMTINFEEKKNFLSLSLFLSH